MCLTDNAITMGVHDSNYMCVLRHECEDRLYMFYKLGITKERKFSLSSQRSLDLGVGRAIRAHLQAAGLALTTIVDVWPVYRS